MIPLGSGRPSAWDPGGGGWLNFLGDPSELEENRPFWSEKTSTDVSTVAQGVERGALDLVSKRRILLMFMEVSLHFSNDSGGGLCRHSPLDLLRHPTRQY